MAFITFKKELTVGALIQIVGLAATALLFWDRMEQRQRELIEEAQKSRQQLERVERYLSSKDPHYWELIRQMNFDFERKRQEEAHSHVSNLSRAAIDQFRPQ